MYVWVAKEGVSKCVSRQHAGRPRGSMKDVRALLGALHRPKKKRGYRPIVGARTTSYARIRGMGIQHRHQTSRVTKKKWKKQKKKVNKQGKNMVKKKATRMVWA